MPDLLLLFKSYERDSSNPQNAISGDCSWKEVGLKVFVGKQLLIKSGEDPLKIELSTSVKPIHKFLQADLWLGSFHKNVCIFVVRKQNPF